MITITVIIGILGIMLAAAFLVGLILHDIRMVKLETAYRQHPHARKWRWRPIIALYMGNLSPKFTQRIRHIYRKFDMNGIDTSATELHLVLPREVALHKDTLLAALRYFGEDKTISTLELIPIISTPSTVRSLLGNYRLILASMLMKSRLGLKITSNRSLFPVLLRRSTIHQTHLQKSWQHLYSVTNYSVAIGLPTIITYGLSLAVGFGQTDLLLVILAGFCIFLVTAIWSYDRLSIGWRFVYTLLAPVSLGYFFALAWLRPLKMLADMAKAKVPVCISFLVRIKDVLRIV